MIDLKAARNDPDSYRAALARKGAGEAFDAVLEADERWRALVPRIDELRGKTKLKGKPTPEQLAEMQQVKEELQDSRGGARGGRSRTRQALGASPQSAAASRVPDGWTRTTRRSPARGRAATFPDGARALEVGNFEMERAARMSGARFGYWVGDTALPRSGAVPAAIDRLPTRAS